MIIVEISISRVWAQEQNLGSHYHLSEAGRRSLKSFCSIQRRGCTQSGEGHLEEELRNKNNNVRLLRVMFL